MSIYRCFECDEMKDADHDGCEDTSVGLVCALCFDNHECWSELRGEVYVCRICGGEKYESEKVRI